MAPHYRLVRFLRSFLLASRSCTIHESSTLSRGVRYQPMQTVSAPWTAWWQEDLPCRFSRLDAGRNRDFLVDLLGAEWFRRALQPQSSQPLIAKWMTNGANAFLLLNALAEDAGLLTSVAGFGQVLEDLRNGGRCLPAWHLVRGAAMFLRTGGVVSQFYEQTEKGAPDFSVKFNGIEANVEAKLLLKSDLEEAFEGYAQTLVKRIFGEVMADEQIHPPVTAIFKDADNLADAGEVANAVAALLRHPKLPAKEFRGASFNVIIGPKPPGVGLFRSFYALCPRSEGENLRVLSRVSKASQQLQSDSAAERPGIVWLGMTRHQNSVFVRNLLLRKFNAGQFSGISQVYLLASGTHLERPMRTVVDYGVRVVNPKSRVTLTATIPVKPLGLIGDLIALHGSEAGLPAYRVGAVETRCGAGMPQLLLPDLRRVD
jgi:hypothetical protein